MGIRVRTRGTVLSVLATVSLVAVPSSAAPRRPIRFERLSLEQGLSQSSVNRILQDSRGYIWLATEDGLNRYDGIRLRIYRNDVTSPTSLPAAFVWDLAEDANGDLWIATGGGLATWKRASDTIVLFEPLASQGMRALCFSPKEGVLWVGTRDSGLYRLHLSTRRLTRFVHDPATPSSLVDDRIQALHLDRAGRLWVGTEGGLERFDPGAEGFVHLAASPSSDTGLSEPRVRAILEDDSGSLWVGTAKGGLNRLTAQGRLERFRHRPEDPSSLADDQVRALLQDSEGRLWVGTGDGLDLLDPSRHTFMHYRADPRDSTSLGDGHIQSLAQDRGGVLWVGTRLGGAHKWNPLSWQLGHVAADPRDPGALGSPHVTSFSEDREGRLWIGTLDAGLYAMDRASGRMTAYRHDPKNPRSLASDRVMALRRDSRGRLWIATADAGVDRFDPAGSRFEHHRRDPARPDSLAADGITTILEDREGRLWLGTYGSGLDRLDPESGRVQHFRRDPKDSSSLSSDRIGALAETPDGKLWVGTIEKGLVLLDPRTGRAERYQHRVGDSASLASDKVAALYLDPEGDVWAGTQAGLSHLDPATMSLRNYTTRDGLPNDVVYGVLGDRQGRLWLSTNNGLSCFDPRSGRFRNYGVSEGIQATEFNFGAAFQSPSGELVFGGVNGFNAFFPERLRQVRLPPAVVLTGITVGRRPLATPADQLRELQVGFRDRVIEIEFAALDFTDPAHNTFAYRLEGFDPDWVPISGRQSVTYTNLGAGRYTFRLRGANSAGVLAEQPLALPIRIAPPPWATPWAFAGYFLVVAAVAFAVVQLLRRNLRDESAYAHALEQRVQERTRELSERQQELERVNRELAQASVTDSLTGLANRRFLTEYLEKEVALLHRRYRRQGKTAAATDLHDLAFLMIDIDHFKIVNDSAGHAAGDAVLRQMRDVLLAVSRSSDIVVRWGGDEFLLVARELGGDGLRDLVERVRDAVEQRVFEVGEGRIIRVTCSIGYAPYPFFREQLDALSWEQAVSVADRALYVAKASGRNAWVGFTPGLAALPIHGLFGAVCHDVQQVVGEGTLRVSSSLPEAQPLVWEIEAAGMRS
jgi:diguanylate cyclase (GGDEF)-like protein